MPPTNSKNVSLGGAATDLGLGDMLTMQLQNETDEQKKKRLALAQSSGLNPGGAASALFGGTGSYGG